MKMKPSLKQILIGAGALIVLVLVGWFAWPVSNPLLGNWVAIDKDTDPFRVSVTLIGQIEFTPEAMKLNGAILPTTYEVIDSNTVLARVQTYAGGISEERYTIRRTLSGLVIQRPVPFMPDGMVEYRRIDSLSSGQRPS